MIITSIMKECLLEIFLVRQFYIMETLPEADVMIKNNIRVEFIDFVEGKSTTSTIEKINKNK